MKRLLAMILICSMCFTACANQTAENESPTLPINSLEEQSEPEKSDFSNSQPILPKGRAEKVCILGGSSYITLLSGEFEYIDDVIVKYTLDNGRVYYLSTSTILYILEE